MYFSNNSSLFININSFCDFSQLIITYYSAPFSSNYQKHVFSVSATYFELGTVHARYYNGPKGTVICRVVESCPGCSFGDLDLSPAAFERIANLELGRAINWDFIN
ncbi:9971_t:CDS:2 [Funneliformis caledonium]|uniref:9971_t:CDS:1 n=1 Tax=Funneliformis caledonium TaxID=1117310 RepID=A0A9N9AMT3_9GLOM|nr:9971_t:CDS:2 [Funneliformis caledonium]